MQHVSKVLGVKWEHRNEKILLEETGAIVVANHQSALDILGKGFHMLNILSLCVVFLNTEGCNPFPLIR